VSTVALSSQALKGFGGSRVDVERLNAHSREVAVVVANILPQPQSVDLEAAYLHPIGTLVLATALPEDWRAANRTAQQTGMPLEVALEESLGFGAVHAGAYLLRLWNLDPFVPAVVERIREPWKLDGRERVVAGAIWAAHIALHSEAPPAPDPLPDDLADLLARAEDATEAPE
jgi:HD-like signal output (HDOD) protein